jgi:ribulose-phosphate 3-epimerase
VIKTQRKAKIAPSMMCADIAGLEKTLCALEAAGVDYLHIDVMDGVFVPNYALGTDYAGQLRGRTAIPLDLHLMIERPEDKIGWFRPRPGDYVSVHFESTPHIHRAVARIREAGARPMVALNPATHYRAAEPLLDDIDAVLVMTVNPGFAGQRLVESTLRKIAGLRRWLDDAGYAHIEIEADGNVNLETAKRMRKAGADIFVAGSSSVFAPGADLTEAVRKLREAVHG